MRDSLVVSTFLTFNSAVINNFVYIFLHTSVWISLGHVPRSPVAGQKAWVCFPFQIPLFALSIPVRMPGSWVIWTDEQTPLPSISHCIWPRKGKNRKLAGRGGKWGQGIYSPRSLSTESQQAGWVPPVKFTGAFSQPSVPGSRDGSLSFPSQAWGRRVHRPALLETALFIVPFLYLVHKFLNSPIIKSAWTYQIWVCHLSPASTLAGIIYPQLYRVYKLVPKWL